MPSLTPTIVRLLESKWLTYTAHRLYAQQEDPSHLIRFELLD
jgi:hypothetical protein